jgi:hypothetical protein
VFGLSVGHRLGRIGGKGRFTTSGCGGGTGLFQIVMHCCEDFRSRIRNVAERRVLVAILACDSVECSSTSLESEDVPAFHHIVILLDE